MSIDMNINKLFNEKNQTLFFNKLVMDLENNTDTFKLATKHIVMIEIAKLLSSLKKIYDKYSVSIEDEKVKELLNHMKTTLLDDINIVIDNKFSTNKDNIEENRQQGDVSFKCLENYHKHIDESEKIFEDSLNLSVKEATEVDLYQSLTNIYSSVNEEMHNDIINTINISFASNLINRIKDESIHRSMTLKNMSKETYDKYLNLTKNSDNVSSDKKIKIKKDRNSSN